MIISIILFGAFALPFASFTEKSYSNLVTYSALWLTMAAVSAAYGPIESSYIPLFMRESGWFDRAPTESASATPVGNEVRHKSQINIGTKASVLSLVAGNLGSIISLLIGVIIANTSRSGAQDGYSSFLIAITVGGTITVVLGGIGWFFVPSVQGPKAPSKNLAFLALKNRTCVATNGHHLHSLTESQNSASSNPFAGIRNPSSSASAGCYGTRPTPTSNRCWA